MLEQMRKNTLKNGIKKVIYNNKTRCHIYMLPIAGQTVEQVGLKNFVDTHG